MSNGVAQLLKGRVEDPSLGYSESEHPGPQRSQIKHWLRNF